MESAVGVEFYPLGGGVPVAVLAANTAYEIYYSGASYAQAGYTLTVSGAGVASVAPAAQGPWSNTGLFAHTALGDAGALVLDDLAPGAMVEASSGYLCHVTTGTSGPLHLQLLLYRSDDENQTAYLLSGEADYPVGNPPQGE